MLQSQNLFITKQMLWRPLFLLGIPQTIKEMGYIELVCQVSDFVNLLNQWNS